MTEKSLDAGEIAAFDIYFASIAAMQFHPGAGTREHKIVSADDCAKTALEMLRIRRAIMNQEGTTCLGQ